jgi:translation initiation factor IF-2
MSDTENSEDAKTQGGRRTLQLRKTVETGQVRQNFSHGRSKAVLVEVKRKRSFLKPEEAAAEAAQAEVQKVVAPVAPVRPVVETPAPRRAPAAVEVHDRLTSDEREHRAKALQGAVKAAAEDMRQSQELSAQRQAAEAIRREAEDKAAAETAERKAQEEARRKAAEAEAASQAEALIDMPLPEEEGAVEKAARKAAEAKKGHIKAVVEVEAGSDEEVRKGGKAAPVKAPARRVDERRRSGKLTVTAALSDEDGTRTRSLASLRRAREKEKRHQMMLSQSQGKQVREVIIPEVISVQELANRMAERAIEVIKTLMKMGVMTTINENLDADTAELVVAEFGHKAKRVSESDVEIGVVGEADLEANLQPRPPVVTVMGHVDHGKTSLLDALRATDVTAGESGGITQHIGAYQVHMASGDKITFLDTPGHEAFTAMRSRGAKVTDIVVLVVAADDGVMPQTVEAINHAKAANVPIILAINKIDKHEANADRVRKELLQHGIVVESLGGDVQEVEVSALKKLNLDKLEEAILLQAEVLELKANPNRLAEGAIIEAQLDKGRGPVATALVHRGTLRVGDVFVAGAEWGRVRALLDERGQRLEAAGPAQPVVVLGLNGTPSAGDDFAVVENEVRAREISAFRQREVRRLREDINPRASLETMFSRMKEEQATGLPIVIKADVQGSAEAIVSALNALSTSEVEAKILHAGVGAITEADISLAVASKAPVIGFNVRANKQALAMAARDGVEIRYYSVIYNLIDDIKAAMSGLLKPEMRETILGTAEVLDVFSAGKAGKAAGCLVTSGFVRGGAMARLVRDDVVVYEGPLGSLRRFKDEVKEVKSGTECGMGFLNFTNIRKGDVVEVFEVEEITRYL